MRRALIVFSILGALTGMAKATSMFFFYVGSGGANGTPGVGCTNQLVLDYSNSCALIGQAWGQ